ncbi:flap endonuclease GEN [Hetaerina americana]|uniref:flap endonuclease GEN n=1 Tax=Hetaerina americana TaxID=62018 RepID=UPI003A7F2530
MLDIRPVFVLEGDAPDIKQIEIKRRINGLCDGDGTNKKIKRSRLNGIISQCQKLLEALGVHSLKSPGEAEAMCARLNDALVVDGCISQDSDCFLYGANVVYRNFSAGCKGNASFAVDSYDKVRIQELLGLDREGLVALALLCGCDYQENSSNGSRGVAGIGIETASQLIRGLSRMCSSVLSRLQSWRSDPNYDKLEKEAVAVNSGSVCIQCSHRGNLGQHDRVGCKSCNSKEGCVVKSCLPSENSLLKMPKEERKLLMLELKVRAKAVACAGFPSQSIIDEFLAPVSDPIKLRKSDISWDRPNLSSFLDIAENYLGWRREYSLAKFLPLLTRWKVMQGSGAAKAMHPNDAIPVSIKKTRVSKGVKCFEVEWNLIPPVLDTSVFYTLEPILLFEKAYSSLSKEFLNKKGKVNSKPKIGVNKKGKLQNKISKVCSCSGSIKDGHICQFVISKYNVQEKAEVPNCDKLSNAVNSTSNLLESVSVEDPHSSSADESFPNSDDDFDPSELSVIINGIVEGNTGSLGKNEGIEDKKEFGKALEQQLDNLKISSWTLSEESSKSFSSDELDNIITSKHSRFKCNLEEGDKVEMKCHGEDVKILCEQLGNINLEKLDGYLGKSETDEHDSYCLPTETSYMKGHFLEPNFDLGASVLLQSPVINNESKSREDR